MATEIWVNIGSGNGLLPDGTKPLPEPMLTYHQWGLKTFTWKKLHERCPNHQSLKWTWKPLNKTLLKSPRGQWVKNVTCGVFLFARSERISKTGAEGTLLAEAKYINVSLHYLEQVCSVGNYLAFGRCSNNLNGVVFTPVLWIDVICISECHRTSLSHPVYGGWLYVFVPVRTPPAASHRLLFMP